MERAKTIDLLQAVKRKLRFRLRAAAGLAIAFGLVCATYLSARFSEIDLPFWENADAVLIAASVGFLTSLVAWLLVRARFQRLNAFEGEASNAMYLGSSSELRDCMDDLSGRAEAQPDFAAALNLYWPRLSGRLEALLNSEARLSRAARIASLCREADQLVKNAAKQRHESNHHVRAKMELEKALAHLRKLVAEADRQFEEALEKQFFKAWSIMTRPGRKQLRKVKSEIATLEAALASVSANPELIAAEQDYRQLLQLIDERLSASKRLASEAIPASHRDCFEPDHALSVGLVSAALSVPVSIAVDLDQAGSVYDALREVNGNYAGMSDLEIWHETLAMPADSLAGLAALTKGSYFERLVESDFGGERFANFNHPDTDIMIDGVAIQIKATDSVSYVESVADHIPVIATTEVAEMTGSIDGGFTDLDLSNAVDLALGGSIVDIGDTVLDGLTTGIGGVGVVAIIRGANAAWGKYRSDGSAVAALGVGVTTTATGVARTIVNFAELGYRGGQLVTKTVVRLGSGERKPAHPSGASTAKAQSPSAYATPFDEPSATVFNIRPKPAKS